MKKHIVSHTDLDGIARAAAVLSCILEWSDASVHIRYSRKYPGTMPSTLADALKTWLGEAVPPGSQVLFIDIPVDVRNPATYIGALREFSKNRDVVWTDHHETDLPYLQQLQEFARILWFGPSAYDYTYELVKWLGGDVNKARVYAILSGLGDRDPKVIYELEAMGESLEEWLKVSDGMDVLIRKVSSQMDPADYGELARRLAFEPDRVLEEARGLGDQIPVPSNYEALSPIVVIVNEELPGAWGPKSLERVALKTGAVYAFGVSFNPRDKTYTVRAISYWVALAKQNVPEVGKLPTFQEWLAKEGKKAFGPPAAPVIPGFPDIATALEKARELARRIAAQHTATEVAVNE